MRFCVNCPSSDDIVRPNETGTVTNATFLLFTFQNRLCLVTERNNRLTMAFVSLNRGAIKLPYHRLPLLMAKLDFFTTEKMNME